MNSKPTKVSNLLLTGPPGVGKTTVVRRLLRHLGEVQVSGFMTDEIREAGRRVGFAATTVAGERRVMAHCDLVSRHRVGRYGVDVTTVDYVVDVALDEHTESDAFVIDEIGKMELYSERFVAAIGRLLADPRPLVATIAQRGGGLIESARRRPDVEVWQVGTDNRDALPDRVAAWVLDRLA